MFFQSLRENVAMNLAFIVISKSIFDNHFLPIASGNEKLLAMLLQPTVFKTNPRAAKSAYLAWGIFCAENGDSKGALYYWKLADSASLWEHFAKLFWIKGHTEAALEFYQRAILVEPSRLEIYFILGRIYWQHLKRIEDAAKIYEKIISIAPPDSFAQFMAKGYGFYIKNQWSLALHEYEMAIQQAGLEQKGMARDTETLVSVFRQAAYSAEHIGNFTKTIQLFREAIKLPHDSQSWTVSWLYIELGHVLIKDGKLDEASSCFFEAGKLSPDNPGLALAHEKLGKAYYDRENYGKAVTEYRTAININPKVKDYYYSLGELYEKLGFWSDAANEYRQILKLTPNDTLAQRALVHMNSMNLKVIE